MGVIADREIPYDRPANVTVSVLSSMPIRSVVAFYTMVGGNLTSLGWFESSGSLVGFSSSGYAEYIFQIPRPEVLKYLRHGMTILFHVGVEDSSGNFASTAKNEDRWSPTVDDKYSIRVVDPYPPKVGMRWTASTMTSADIFEIWVTASSASGIDSVRLQYTVDEGEKHEIRVVQKEGEGNSYHLVIPKQPAGAVVEFRVNVVDKAGKAVSFGPYSYPVRWSADSLDSLPPRVSIRPGTLTLLGPFFILIGAVIGSLIAVFIIYSKRQIFKQTKARLFILTMQQSPLRTRKSLSWFIVGVIISFSGLLAGWTSVKLGLAVIAAIIVIGLVELWLLVSHGGRLFLSALLVERFTIINVVVKRLREEPPLCLISACYVFTIGIISALVAGRIYSQLESAALQLTNFLATTIIGLAAASFLLSYLLTIRTSPRKS